jgi:hypothetical protein
VKTQITVRDIRPLNNLTKESKRLLHTLYANPIKFPPPSNQYVLIGSPGMSEGSTSVACHILGDDFNYMEHILLLLWSVLTSPVPSETPHDIFRVLNSSCVNI